MGSLNGKRGEGNFPVAIWLELIKEERHLELGRLGICPVCHLNV